MSSVSLASTPLPPSTPIAPTIKLPTINYKLNVFYTPNRIIQAHFDYLEDLKPIRSATRELLNNTYVECNRRLQALWALWGEY
jgi:hypothetical protein